LHLIEAEGNVRVFGKDFFAQERECKQLIGYVGGGFHFYASKQLKQVAKAVSAFYSDWDEQRYLTWLARFSLDEKQHVCELSEGMKVKFALTLALSHQAKLLILDEPTSGLDPLSREELCDILLSLVQDEGVSVLFSTHITTDLLRIADDVCYLSNGKVLAFEPLKTLLGRYRVAVFSQEEAAYACKQAVGLKRVKDGYEGLIPSNILSVEGATLKGATLDEIMIHLEVAKSEEARK
jgi:ABC-2 type transport system ATP-binding protein